MYSTTLDLLAPTLIFLPLLSPCVRYVSQANHKPHRSWYDASSAALLYVIPQLILQITGYLQPAVARAAHSDNRPLMISARLQLSLYT